MASDVLDAARESGEVEEGELPTEPTADRGHESGEASGFEDTHSRRRRGIRQVLPRPPVEFLSPRHGGGPRVVLSPRGAPPPGIKHSSRDTVQDEQARQAAKDEREREELSSELRELTRYVSVQDAMRSLDTVCVDLKKAIKKLDKLLRKVKKKKTDDVANYPECLQFSKRLLEGLKSINVVVGTSIGHTHSMEAVLALFRAAMNYRHDVFTAPAKAELESWVHTTKVLKVIIEEKQQQKGKTSLAAGGGRAGSVGAQDGADGGAQQQQSGQTDGAAGSGGGARLGSEEPSQVTGPPSTDGVDKEMLPGGDVQTLSPVPETSNEGPRPDSPPLPPVLPPPPSEPYTGPIQHTPEPEGEVAGNGHCAPLPQSPTGGAVIPSGSGATGGNRLRTATSLAASAAFKFNIIVSSTALEEVKANSDGPQQNAHGQQQPPVGQPGANSGPVAAGGTDDVVVRDVGGGVVVAKRGAPGSPSVEDLPNKKARVRDGSAGGAGGGRERSQEPEGAARQREHGWDRGAPRGWGRELDRDMRSQDQEGSVDMRTSSDGARASRSPRRSQDRDREGVDGPGRDGRERSRERVGRAGSPDGALRGTDGAVERPVRAQEVPDRQRPSRWDRQPVVTISRSHSHSRERSNGLHGREMSHSPERNRARTFPMPESPMSDDRQSGGPNGGPGMGGPGGMGAPGGGLPNGHHLQPPMTHGPPGLPGGRGWTFEERERHRVERERMEWMERDGMGGGPMHMGMREREAGPDEVGVLLRRGRLALAIDLDHTLLNSVRFADLDGEMEAQLGQRLAVEASSVPDHQRELYRSERLGIWTKLRPGAREFLARAAEKFELWVYSSGTRPYADAMASLLDPEDRYFEGRIVAAGGGVDGPDGPSGVHNKRLMTGLELRSPVVIALDDAGSIWPMEHRLALLSVERYLFFPAIRRRFGLEGRSLLQINRDECPDRGMLMTMWHLIERLHGLVFTYLHHPGPAGQLLSAPPAEPRFPPWDVRNVLTDERRKVLQGVYLSFSRVFPVDMDPRGHPLWRMAEAYGAVCDPQCCERTTHVVATTRGTDKTLWAAQKSKMVVTPAWLECCCALWRKANEDRFRLAPQALSPPPQPQPQAPSQAPTPTPFMPAIVPVAIQPLVSPPPIMDISAAT